MKRKRSPFPRHVYQRNAAIYKLLSNPKRLELLNILRLGETSADDLRKLVKVSPANLSQHLSLLRYGRLVTARREGARVYYRIVDPRVVAPCRILWELWRKNGSGRTV
jgi:ArsR family transcriptional regulator